MHHDYKYLINESTEIDRLEKKIRDQFQKAFGVRYDGDVDHRISFVRHEKGDDSFNITISLFGVDMLDVNIKVLDVDSDRLLLFINDIVKHVSAVQDRATALFKEAKSLITSEIPRKDKYEPKISIGVGSCSYQSIGHIKYAYVKFDSTSFRASWSKVFFNGEEILYDRTIKHMKNQGLIRSAPKRYNTRPPSVLPIVDKHIPYCAEALRKSTTLHSRLMKLPLNTSGIREDLGWTPISIGRKSRIDNGKIFIVPCLINEVADPARIVAFISASSNSNRAKNSMVMYNDELWVACRHDGWIRGKYTTEYSLETKVDCDFARKIMNSLLTDYFNKDHKDEEDEY